VTDAVRALVLTNDHHAWSLDELLTAVREDIDTADFSTIFRAVANLERSGAVDRVDVGDGKTRYESRRAHHEHIRCTSCGRVAEVPGCVLDQAVASVQRRTGFRVADHQVVFTGLCPDCRKQSRPSRREAAL
jgi:Fur family transcriptional regulator, peroxide stress response regulator